MMDRTCWFIKIWNEENPAVFGLGECSPLPGLSPDYEEDATVLNKIVDNINNGSLTITATNGNEITEFIDYSLSDFNLANFPSIRFALECALLDLIHGGQRILFKNKFLEGGRIPINGLVWMGGMDFILQQVEIKIQDGFRCVKLKVGG